MWNCELPRKSANPRILGCYLISDSRVVVHKAHHKHTQYASALFHNFASHKLSPSVSLALWKLEIIIPAVKCNSLSHKTVLEI